ncbi:hypothetical protein [Corallococcus carmarthensis]|uniref:hypothetical protein n=1 Tax=Corallococcus carmarthensis TaxID=2316728 RepID=UPI0011C411A8|nr:hypothetical protein [Corallococcus carmarthensis]
MDGHLAHHARLRRRLQHLPLRGIAGVHDELAQRGGAGQVVAPPPRADFVDPQAAQVLQRVEDAVPLREALVSDKHQHFFAREHRFSTPRRVSVQLLRQFPAALLQNARRRRDELLRECVAEHHPQRTVDVQDGARGELPLALHSLFGLQRSDELKDMPGPHLTQEHVADEWERVLQAVFVGV